MAAYAQVNESKFLIPEEIPTQERTAFMGAAAAAHKSGQSHFNFGGKKHKVTMQKDTATAIADQKEAADLDKTNADKAIKHDCATHVEHAEWGEGNPISGQHTIVETTEGNGYVTHYDVVFEHGIERDVAVEDLTILAEMHHGHSKKKKVDEMFQRYNVTHKPTKKKYTVLALSKNSAKDKARAEHGGTRGSSRYAGTSNDDFHVEAVEVQESKKAALAKKLAKASAGSEKGKAAVTLPKAPFPIPKKESLADRIKGKMSANEEDDVVMNPKKEKKEKNSDAEMAQESMVYTRIKEARKMKAAADKGGEHTKSATDQEEMGDKQASSKGAQDMMNTPKQVVDNPEASGDEVNKAASAGPKAAMRKGDNAAGDKKIIPSATPTKGM